MCDRKKKSLGRNVSKTRRTKHASLVLGESQLNAGAPEIERSEGSANVFDVSRRRRSVAFIIIVYMVYDILEVSNFLNF